MNNSPFSIFHFPFRRSRQGFTLIEIMVVITISLLLVSGGIAAYTSFNERETIKAKGQELYNDLRFAQGKAASSEKPPACAQGGLEGYQLRFVTATSYLVEAICEGGVVDIGISKNLSLGIALDSFDNNAVMFSILGKGAQTASFCLSGFDRFYKIDVSNVGGIINHGLVDSC